MLQIIDNLYIPEHSILVTIDVETVYSSIPHDKGIATILHTLRTKATQIKFLILDRIHRNPRGWHWNKVLLQMELRWIHNLKATCSPGLNEVICFKPFLEGFSSGGNEK